MAKTFEERRKENLKKYGISTFEDRRQENLNKYSPAPQTQPAPPKGAQAVSNSGDTLTQQMRATGYLTDTPVGNTRKVQRTTRTSADLRKQLEGINTKIAEFQAKAKEAENDEWLASISHITFNDPAYTLDEAKSRRSAALAAVNAYQRQRDTVAAQLDDTVYNEYMELAKDPHFAELSRYRTTRTGKPENNKLIGSAGYVSEAFADPLYDYINGNKEAEGFIAIQESKTGAKAKGFDKTKYSQMTPEEVAVYNYLYTKGKDRADEFLKDIDKKLSQRQAGIEAARIDAEPNALKRGVAKAITAGQSGLDSSIQGLAQAMTDEVLPKSQLSYTGAAVRETTSGLGRLAYDSVELVSHMLPSILTSYAIGGAGGAIATTAKGVKAVRNMGQIASSLVTAVSAAGNSYAEQMEKGLTKKQSKTIAALTGASEGGLQYLLSGISAMGGKATNNILSNKIAGIGNGLARVGAKFVASGIGEATEEVLQLFVEPAIIAAVTGEAYQAPTVEEVVYTALLSAISAGFFEGAEIARDEAGLRRAGRVVIATDSVQAVIDDAAASDNPAMRRLADKLTKRLEEGKKITAYDLGRIVAESANPDALIQAPKEAAETQTETVETPAATAEIPSAVGETLAQAVAKNATTTASERISEPVVQTETPAAVEPAPVARVEAHIEAAETPTQSLEGGTTNEKDYAPTVHTLDQIFDGSPERNAGISAGEQAGSVESSGSLSTANQGRRASQRRNIARNLRLQKVSASSLGIERGTEAESVSVLPRSEWDEELIAVAEKVKKKTGLDTEYVVGAIEIYDNDNSITTSRGVITPRKIIVRVDHVAYTATQIAAHEVYHDYANRTPALIAAAKQRIIDTYGEKEFYHVLGEYIKALRDVCSTEYDVMHELFADAFAGMNAFGLGADKWQPEVKQTVTEHLKATKSAENAAATDRTTGPPEDVNQRSSFDDLAETDINYLRLAENPQKNEIELRRMVDDAAERAGYDIKAYHGTPNGDFTVFRDWQYFTEDEGYASNYMYQGASSNGYKKEARRPRVYNVYLKTERVFDTRNPEEREIFETQFYRQWGNGAPLSDRGLPDWTDGDDLTEFFDEYGYDYDAILLDEGGVGGYGEEVVDRGVSIVVKNSEQIKLADTVTYDDSGNVIPLSERFNENKPDIRYSFDDTVEIDEYSGADVNNPEYAKYVNKGIAQERKADKEAKPKREKVTKPVAKSKPIFSSKDLKNDLLALFSVPDGRKKIVGGVIERFGEKQLKQGRIDGADLEKLMDFLYDEGVMSVPADDYYRAGRDIVYKGKVYVSPDIKSAFGDDWNSFKQRAFAAGVYLTNNPQHSSVDQWNEVLANSMPGEFDTNDYDMPDILERIVDLAEAGKEEKMTLDEYVSFVSRRDHVNRSVVYENLENQLIRKVETFAEKAKLELALRDRTGIVIAQEREKFAETTQKAEERRRASEAKKKADRQKAVEEQREAKRRRELEQDTLKQLQKLNSEKKHMPEEMKKAAEALLSDIDILAAGVAKDIGYSKKYKTTWQDVVELYKEAQQKDPNWMPTEELERKITRLSKRKVSEIEEVDLNTLLQATIALRKEWFDRKKLISDSEYSLFEDVFKSSKTELESAHKKSRTDTVKEGARKLFNYKMLTPMNAISAMTDWNPDSALLHMARQLEDGERKVRDYYVKANGILAEFMEKNKDWLSKADGQGKNGIWEQIEVPTFEGFADVDARATDAVWRKPIFGDNVKIWITPLQKVHMYLESKNNDNLRHMMGGRVFADKELYSQGKRTEAFAEGQRVRLAPETVKQIVSTLTEQEQQLADLLYSYYNSFAKEEVNRVSNTLNGFDKAVVKNYAPIFTDANYRGSEFGVFDASAEGVGSLKERKTAGYNPSLNLSALDAFERNVDQVSRYVGIAIPTHNWKALLKMHDVDGRTLKDVISHTNGIDAERYIEDFITDLQAGVKKKQDYTLFDKAHSNYIASVFGGNPSVVLKQLGSVPMAATYLGATTLPSPKQIKNTDKQLIAKYTSELAYRGLGYATLETKQLKDAQGWSQKNKAVQFALGGGSIVAMDQWAAGVLWPWAENKVRREQPDLEVGTAEEVAKGESPFYKAVAKEFNEAVVNSQSMSDTSHVSAARKSDNAVLRTLTMFTSDASQAYNMIRSAVGEAMYYKKVKAPKDVQKAANRKVGRAFMGVLGNAMWSTGITFLINLIKQGGAKYKDDDDELTAESVAKTMMTDIVQQLAGIAVIGGEELAEVFGAIITGSKRYDVESPGLSVVNDLLGITVNLGKTIKTTATDVSKILGAGGTLKDINRYLQHNGGNIANVAIKSATDMASFFGLPLNNVKAYMLGIVSAISPQAKVAYEDLLSEPARADLKGLSGDALSLRTENIFAAHNISIDKDAAETLAGIYTAGYANAIPSSAPSSITVDGETKTLDAMLRIEYERKWSEVVNESLAEVMDSKQFAEADLELQSKMLKRLYDFASEQAKAELFENYEVSSFVAKGEAVEAAGVELPEFITTYAKFSQIGDESLTASEKSTKFSAWLNAQGFSASEKKAIQDNLKYYAMMASNSERYDEFVSAGLDDKTATALNDALKALSPEDGKTSVSYVQKWNVAVEKVTNEKQLQGVLKSLMTDEQYAAYSEVIELSGIPSAMYVKGRTLISQYGSSNEQITWAIQDMASNNLTLPAVGKTKTSLTDKQRAILWQVWTGSTSTKNNPWAKNGDAKQAAQEIADKAKAEADDAKERREAELEAQRKARK